MEDEHLLDNEEETLVPDTQTFSNNLITKLRLKREHQNHEVQGANSISDTNMSKK